MKKFIRLFTIMVLPILFLVVSCGNNNQQIIDFTVFSQSYIYDGSAKTPEIENVTINGETLSSEFYDVIYSDNVNAGVATITVTAKNGFSGVVTKNFIISKATCGIPSSINASYGEKLSEIELFDGCSWVEDDDLYVGDYGENVFHLNYVPTDNVNYESKTNVAVTINVGKIDCPELELPSNLKAYYGSQFKYLMLPESEYGEFEFLAEDNDYVGNVGINNYDIKFTPNTTNYNTQYFTIEMEVLPISIKNSSCAFNKTEFFYSGDKIEPTLLYLLKNNQQIDKSNYEVRYYNNTNVGIGTIVIVGVNNYCDMIGPYHFEIKESDMDVDITTYSGVYDGQIHNLVTNLTNSVGSYPVRYRASIEDEWSATMPTNKNAGSYSYQIKVDGGTLHGVVIQDVSMLITPKLITANFELEDKNYTGNPITLSFSLVGILNDDEIEANISGNIETEIGEYTAIISGLLGKDSSNYTIGETEITKTWNIVE